MSARNNTIGGTTAAARNVISANGVDGTAKALTGGERQPRRGQLHRHRCHRHGGPGQPGRASSDRRRRNTVGGTAAGAGNLISGNSAPRDLVLRAASGNVVRGQHHRHGHHRRRRPWATRIRGIAAGGAIGNNIGGTTAAARQHDLGQRQLPAQRHRGPSGNVVEGNYIGTNAAGTAALGNAATASTSTRPPATPSAAHGRGAGNVISGNVGNGRAGSHQRRDRQRGRRATTSAPTPPAPPPSANGGDGIDINRRRQQHHRRV